MTCDIDFLRKIIFLDTRDLKEAYHPYAPIFLDFYVKRANLLKGLVTLGQANLMFVLITFCSLVKKFKSLKI